MVIITTYYQVKKDGKIYIQANEVSKCPICFSEMRIIGSRDRKATENDGSQQVYVIRRLRCTRCGKIHHELPDLLIPYKRHRAEKIEEIVSNMHSDDTLEQTTTRRLKKWWEDISLYFIYIKQSLELKYQVRFPDLMMPKEIVRILTNTHLWRHTRSAPLSNL